MRNAAGELPVTQQRLRQLPAVTGRKQREVAVTRNTRRHNKEQLPGIREDTSKNALEGPAKDHVSSIPGRRQSRGHPPGPGPPPWRTV